jgi:ABC-type multidrug transport system fused ATPase/permease subunit
VRYSGSLEPAVKNLDLVIEPGTKIGIVGRTGAGKSSIISALLRFTNLHSGKVFVDGLDVKYLGLHLLRKNIAYIPQQPFLMQTSILKNIDPFGEHGIGAVMKAL